MPHIRTHQTKGIDMGLDQWLYRAARINDTEKGRIEARLYRNCPEHISLVRNDDLVDDIRHVVATPVTVTCETFDEELFRADNGIAPDADLVGVACHQAGMTYSYDQPEDTDHRDLERDVESIMRTVTRYLVSDEELDRRYTILTSAPENYVALKLGNDHYWRNNRVVEDAVATYLERHGKSLENCGYYIVDDEFLQEILAADPTVPVDLLAPDETFPYLLYHEWY